MAAAAAAARQIEGNAGPNYDGFYYLRLRRENASSRG